MYGYPVAAWLVVAALAIFAGIVIAKRFNRDAGWYLKRNICPDCKARKSLLHRPIGDRVLRSECAECGSVWKSHEPGYQPIVAVPAPPLPASSLEYTTSLKTHNPLFRTAVGEIEIDISSLVMSDFSGVKTPRDFLRRGYELGVRVERIELKPEYRSGTIEEDVLTFMRSAGIETADKKEGPNNA